MKISQNNTIYFDKSNKQKWNKNKSYLLEQSIDIKNSLSSKNKLKLNNYVIDLQDKLNSGQLDHENLIEFAQKTERLGLSPGDTNVLLNNLIILAKHRDKFYIFRGIFSNTNSINNFLLGNFSKVTPDLIIYNNNHHFNCLLVCALIKAAIGVVYKDEIFCDEADKLFEKLLKINIAIEFKKEIITIANINIENRANINRKFAIEQPKNITITKPYIILHEHSQNTSSDAEIARLLHDELNKNQSQLQPQQVEPLVDNYFFT